MIEFRDLVYLDVQKTGSTHIGWALRHLLGEEPVRFRKHSRVLWPSRDKMHFISVRDPVRQYISLFRYGCDGRGAIARRIRRRGHGDLYQPTPEHLRHWLRLVLDPRQAHWLGEGYAWSGMAPLVGFMSFRVIALSLPGPLWALRRVRSQEALRKLLNERALPHYVVRNESLNQDLLTMLQREENRLSFSVPVSELETALSARTVTNPSRSGQALSPSDLDDDLRARLREREWVLYEHYGYST